MIRIFNSRIYLNHIARTIVNVLGTGCQYPNKYYIRNALHEKISVCTVQIKKYA